MTDSNSKVKIPDPDASWQAQQQRQGRDWLKLSYAQRLQWLEQAKQFATLALKAADARRQNK